MIAPIGKPCVAAALAMTAAATLLVGSAHHRARDAEDARDRARLALDRAAAEWRQRQAADADMVAASEQLQQLEREGALAIDAPEDRQAWLRENQLALRLPAMRLRLGPSAPWPGGDAGAYAWSAMPLHLELELLHEGDLSDFLARIAGQVPLLVRECRLFRAGASPAPRMHAACELQWLSLRRTDTR